jgi:hypothetical protein
MNIMAEFSTLEDQIRECFGRVVYTHKTHEKMADNCARTLWSFKVAQIGIAALTACGALALVFVDNLSLKIATAAVSFVTLCISGYMKGFDPGGTAQKHRDTAANLWIVRESYLSLLTDLRMGMLSNAEAITQRDDLQKKLAAIYRGAPHTNGKAYAAAQTALQQNEDYTFSDTEIDKFVPSGLKKMK